MYNNIKSRISTAEGTSAYFPCNCGVHQGENLSPFLFSLYLNDLEYYLYSNSAPGVKCETHDENIFIYLKIFILLYADDKSCLVIMKKIYRLHLIYLTNIVKNGNNLQLMYKRQKF